MIEVHDKVLSVCFDHTHTSWSQRASMEHVPVPGHNGHSARVVPRNFKHSLMECRVKCLPFPINLS